MYLALGDSVAYGLQPNLDFRHGYDEALFAWLQPAGSERMVNLSCPGETSETMVRGGCRLRFLAKTAYESAQLDAAVAFIRSNQGQVSPVTLTIGANDVLHTLDRDCSEHLTTFQARLARLDRNLDVILRRLTEALDGQGDLILTTYYNPFAGACPGTDRYLRDLNTHIRAAAGRHGALVADIWPSFEGRTCAYTWMCAPVRDIHPTSAGYEAIAAEIAAVELGVSNGTELRR
jgi:lysophospholipase L1-like esterase